MLCQLERWLGLVPLVHVEFIPFVIASLSAQLANCKRLQPGTRDLENDIPENILLRMKYSTQNETTNNVDQSAYFSAYFGVFFLDNFL